MTIYTLAGSAVQGIHKSNTLTTTQYNNLVPDVAKYGTDNVIVKYPTWNYNGHSYAWYKSSDKNDVWLNLDQAMIYMTDGSYQVVGRYYASDSYPINALGKVFYQCIVGGTYFNHQSGVIYRSTKKQLTSKWAAGCLVRHEQTQCPYYVNDTSYGQTTFVLYNVDPQWVT